VIVEPELDQTKPRGTEDTSGAVRIVPSSRRDTRPNAKIMAASTARSTTVGSRDVEPTRTKQVR
jgi:hypothetical protein